MTAERLRQGLYPAKPLVASPDGRPRTVCLMTADVSGDQNAAHLARAIRNRAPDVRLVGAGGPAMREAGVEVAVQTTDLAFMGVLDSLRIIRQVVVRYRRCKELVRAAEPHLVVLVDNELVTSPFAVWLRRRDVPTAFFFPPQVWLWGRWRLPAIVPLARRFICAFREEAELYRSAGADAIWVGHPLSGRVAVNEDAVAAQRAVGLDPARPLVVLMPGSRRREIETLLAPLLGAAVLLQRRDASLQFAVPVASRFLRADIERAVTASSLRDVAIYPHESYAILSRARIVMQCSGTATLEAALLGIPAVVFYRCKPIEHFVGARVLNAPYIAMVNILLKERVQPEFFHENVDARHLADAAWSLLTDEDRRRAIQVRLAETARLLGPPGAFSRAAASVLELLPAAAQGAVRHAVSEQAQRGAAAAEARWAHPAGDQTAAPEYE